MKINNEVLDIIFYKGLALIFLLLVFIGMVDEESDWQDE